VLRIARKIGYTPNAVARALSVRRSTLRVGVCIPEEIHFFYDQMRSGIKDEARRGETLGIEFIYRPVPKLGENEEQQLTSLLRDKLSALVVVPGNPRVVAPLIDKAEASGVRVVCVSTDAPLSRRSTVVCVNPQLNGRLAAELMAKFVPPQAEVAVITGMLATEDHRKKTEGFQAGFKAYAAGGRVLAVLEAHESEEESYRKTCDLLAREKKICGIYVNTVNCLPVCRAVREHRRSRPLRLITTDLFQQMVPFIENGTIGASVYQDPYRQGRDAVRIVPRSSSGEGRDRAPPTTSIQRLSCVRICRSFAKSLLDLKKCWRRGSGSNLSRFAGVSEAGARRRNPEWERGTSREMFQDNWRRGSDSNRRKVLQTKQVIDS